MDAATLFSVDFHSAMTPAQTKRLAGSLGMSMSFGTALAERGFARLDDDSGLFLVPGKNAGDWRLEARTYGNPPPQLVHDWHVEAANAARELDATVTVPPRRTPARAPAISPRPVAYAQTRRRARVVRRLFRM